MADRSNRMVVLTASALLQSFIAATFGLVLISGLLQTWHIFVYALSIGAIWALSEPSRFSIIPYIVDKKILLNAFSMNTLAFNSSRLFIPTVCGVLILKVGPGSTLLLGSAMYLIASLVSSTLKLTPINDRDVQPGFTFIDETMTAIRHVYHNPTLKVGIALSIIQLLVVMPFSQSLIAVYAADVLKVSADGLGVLTSGLGAGAVATGIALTMVGNLRNKTRLLHLSILISIVGMIILSASTQFKFSIIATTLLGGGMAMQFAVVGAVTMEITPQELRGKISSLLMTSVGLMPVGALISGGIAETLSAPQATAVGIIFLIIVYTIIHRDLLKLWHTTID